MLKFLGLDNFVERFNVFYPKALQAIKHFSGIFSSFVQVLFTSIGVFIMMAFAIWAEQTRVSLGILIVDPNKTNANLIAAVLIAGSIVLKMIKTLYDQEHGQDRYEKNIWDIFGRIIRFFGFGERKEISSSNSLGTALFLVVVIIVIFAFLGSAQTPLREYENLVWYDAIWEVISTSDAITFLSFIGAGLLAFVLVTINIALGEFIAREATRAMDVVYEAKEQIEKQQEQQIIFTPNEAIAKYSRSLRKLKEYRYHKDDRFKFDNKSVSFYNGIEDKWSKSFKLNSVKSRALFYEYLNGVFENRKMLNG